MVVVRRKTSRVQVLRSTACGPPQQPGEDTSGSDSVCRPACSCGFSMDVCLFFSNNALQRRRTVRSAVPDMMVGA